MKIKEQYFLALCLLLLIKALLIVGVILYSEIGLGPDEAQYWTWSHALDWGYYSKPPAIAWQIWLGTKFFGDTELGVRFMAIVLASLLSLVIYFLARACRLSVSTAFWSSVIFTCTPLGIIGALFAITDGGLVLFWALASLVIALALSKEKAPNYYLLGLVILCGALFKWPIYLFWCFVVGFIPLYPYLKNKHLIGGVAVSLLGLLPSVIWNSSHNWVTFRHVFATVIGKGDYPANSNAVFFKGNFFDFLGAQIALLSPILFFLLTLAFIMLIKERKNVSAGLFFCGISSLILLIVYHFLAIFQKMQGNWVDFAYPAAVVVLCWYACEKQLKGGFWLKIGILLSLILSFFALSLSSIQSHAFFKRYQIPYKVNPFRHNLGWICLEYELGRIGYNPKEDFLFGDKYQMTSLLSFYSPGQKRAYFLNLQGIRKNQFSFWPSMSHEQLGRTGFFILAENASQIEEKKISDYERLLQPYFKEVFFLGVKPLFFSYGVPVKKALVFKCIGYNGKEPPEVTLY